jgi:YtfJ family uncharacterized protein
VERPRSAASGAAKHRPLLTLACILTMLSTVGYAAEIRVGERLPPLRIADLGECMIRGEEAVFEPWDSSALLGRIRVVEYVAARASTSRLHEPLYDEIAKAGFPPGELVVTKLVNSDDALWGTSGLVASKVGDNKKEFPENILVVDAKGIGRRRWGLKEASGAIALLDRSGEVLFFKEGGLTEDEIRTVVALVKEHLS